MRVVIQRVTSAGVTIAGVQTAAIGAGYLILLGIETADTGSETDWLCRKIVQLRVMADEAGHMNKDILETGGDILVVSQFTLMAAYKKGNRPSFIKAARPDQAIPLYQAFVATLSSLLGKPVQTGTFGADMQVGLVNDGPVTIVMDTANKE
jgi:D-tyrosyl-tRNA(Tyr) deacylase